MLPLTSCSFHSSNPLLFKYNCQVDFPVISRILLRVCQALKSRARDVRDTARETLVDIASSLGPEYFSFVLKEMKSVLQRGYQV